MKKRMHQKKWLSAQSLILILILLMITSPASSATIKLPSRLQKIEPLAFYGDQSLDVVVLQEGIKSIGSKAFANSSVSEINLPSSLVSIADDALPTDDLFLTVNAKKGTYAYQWAVNHGFIYTFTISPASQTNVPAAGGTYYVYLTFEGNYAQYASYQFDCSVSWMTIKDVSALGGSKKSFRVTVQENTSTASRQGAVTFTCGQERGTYWLTQKGMPECQHQNSIYHGSYSDCIKAYDNGNDLHTAVYVTKYAFTCQDCGKAWVSVANDAKAVVESHNPGKTTTCYDCGAAVRCIHSNAREAQRSDICIRVFDNGNGTHTRVLVTSRVYECPDCGLMWELFDNDERFYNNNHTYNSTMECTICHAKKANINKTIEPPVYIFAPGSLGPGFPPVPLE